MAKGYLDQNTQFHLIWSLLPTWAPANCIKNEKANAHSHIEPQGTLSSQNNILKIRQFWEDSHIWFQDLLLNCSNQNSMVLV